MLNFSSSMKTQELAKWLHLKISDPEFEDDIKKLEGIHACSSIYMYLNVH